MPLPVVHTPLGDLPAHEARALLDMLSHDGIVPLRRLMKTRNVVATTILRTPETSQQRIDFERGALDAILELDGIMDGGLRIAYSDAIEAQESDAHGERDGNRDPGSNEERAGRGPE